MNEFKELTTENERVTIVRKHFQLTMEAFGEKIGLSKSAISNIESGVRTPTKQMEKAICREFNVDEEWLRTGEGEMLRTLDRDEEIAQIVQSLYKEEEDSFKLRLIRVLCAMEEDDWKFMENLLDEIMAKKKGQAEAQP